MRMLITTSAVTLLMAGTAYAADRTSETAGHPNDQTVVHTQGQADNSRIFTEWDADRDGYLSRDEYEAGVRAHPTPEGFPDWDALDAAYADPQGRLLLRDSEKWYPASAITRGTSEDLGGSEAGGSDAGGGDTGGNTGGADGGGAGAGGGAGDGGAGAGGGAGSGGAGGGT